MKINSLPKRIVLMLVLTMGSLLTLPAYAWPEVDHMNMCGSSVKVDRSYGGNFRGWNAHDKFVGYKTRAGYYYRNNCPTIKAPVKSAKTITKKARKTRITSSPKAKAFKRSVKYNEKVDCARVDKMNGTGAAVRLKRGNTNRHWQAVRMAAKRASYARTAKRRYNYFRK